jgi:hypothetical protein
MDIYDKYLAVAGEDAMHYGAAHIVWDDENFDRGCVQACLDDFERWKRDDCTDEQNEAVRQSLLDMLALPDDQREVEPDDYDGEHPDNFPPTCEVVKKR